MYILFNKNPNSGLRITVYDRTAIPFEFHSKYIFIGIWLIEIWVFEYRDKYDKD